MSTLHDQIALVLHTQLEAAGPFEDHECAVKATGVENCIAALTRLFIAQDQLQQVLGRESEFDHARFVRLSQTGGAE